MKIKPNEKIDVYELLRTWWEDEVEMDEFHPSLEIDPNDKPELKQMKVIRRQIAHALDLGTPIEKIERGFISMSGFPTELHGHYVYYSEDNMERLKELGYTRVGYTEEELGDEQKYIMIASNIFGLVASKYLDENNIPDTQRLTVMNGVFIKREVDDVNNNDS